MAHEYGKVARSISSTLRLHCGNLSHENLLILALKLVRMHHDANPEYGGADWH
jgi:hypothetical protein